MTNKTLKDMGLLLLFLLVAAFAFYPKPGELILLFIIGFIPVYVLASSVKKIDTDQKRGNLRDKIIKYGLQAVLTIYTIVFILVFRVSFYENKIVFNILQTRRGRAYISIALLVAIPYLAYTGIFYVRTGRLLDSSDFGLKRKASNLTQRELSEKQSDDRKTYVNARMSPDFSVIVEYAIPAICFFLVPLALVYYFVAFLISVNFQITYIILWGSILSILVLAADILLYTVLRNNWVKEITVDDAGITLIGFYKKIRVTWPDVLSANDDSGTFAKRVKVKTKKGDFYFPLTMKERDKEYPKVASLDEYWIYPGSIKRPITAENCDLVIEIRNRLDSL